MPQRVELADKYGVAIDDTNPVPVDGTLVVTGASAAELATEATLASIDTTLATPATSIPHFATDAASDMTTVFDDGSTAAEESLVSATASQTTRVYRAKVTAAGACTVYLRNGSAGTILRRWVFPAAGAYDEPFDPRPYAVTGANTALYWERSAAVSCSIEIDYIKSA